VKTFTCGLRRWFQSALFWTASATLALLGFAGHLGLASDGQQGSRSHTISGTVETTDGPVTGVLEGDHYVYRGIPYAAPPIGDLRWRAPTSHANWTSFDASHFGNTCPQMLPTGIVGNEDCLTLNVWGPASNPAHLLPVIVFLHGGGNNTFDAKGIPTFNTTGEYFSEHGAVLVSVNFRLGALGFMAHSSLDAENIFHISGNYGVFDQIAALRWVAQNIRGFGGNPHNVTLYGFSAGATDACFLASQPIVRKLFKRVIMSGAPPDCERPTTQVEAENTGNLVVQNAGCSGAADVAACMRALPASSIVAAAPPINLLASPSLWVPVVDNITFGVPLSLIAQFNTDLRPLMIGNDEDELGTFFPPSFVPDEATYEAKLSATFGAAIGAQVLAQYPAAAYPNPYRAFIAATSDHLYICPARRIARAYAAASPDRDDGPLVYRYLFTHALENPNPFVGRGAVHTTDLPFIFHTLGMGGLAYTPTAAEQELSTTLATTWTTFALEADPNNASIPSWPRYYIATDSYLEFNDVVRAVAGVHTAHCDFWDGIDD
jgi:para-nitrobenzyl esterase